MPDVLTLRVGHLEVYADGAKTEVFVDGARWPVRAIVLYCAAGHPWAVELEYFPELVLPPPDEEDPPPS